VAQNTTVISIDSVTLIFYAKVIIGLAVGIPVLTCICTSILMLYFFKKMNQIRNASQSTVTFFTKPESRQAQR